jgi:hypothetical protein
VGCGLVRSRDLCWRCTTAVVLRDCPARLPGRLRRLAGGGAEGTATAFPVTSGACRTTRNGPPRASGELTTATLGTVILIACGRSATDVALSGNAGSRVPSHAVSAHARWVGSAWPPGSLACPLDGIRHREDRGSRRQRCQCCAGSDFISFRTSTPKIPRAAFIASAVDVDLSANCRSHPAWAAARCDAQARCAIGYGEPVDG